jgi:4-amino-4-deoxy-L-arabinose transferase-like glycosyltransferase
MRTLSPSRLAVIAAGALAARLAVVAATPGYRPLHDDRSYARVARSLLILGRYPRHRLPSGGWQASAYRPPGWPGVLWATWRITGRSVLAGRLVEAVIGAAVAVLVAVVATQLFDARTGLAAGLLAAVSPLALAVGASLESETLFTALVLGAAAAALAARDRAQLRWALAAGALAGLAALTRINGLLAIGAIAVLAVPAAARGRARLVPVAAVILVGLAVVAPWTARNAVRLHAFVPVSTETGNTLAGTYNAVSMHNGARWKEPRHTGAYRAIYRRYGGAQNDEELQRAVLRWVAGHPAYPLEVAAANSGRLLGLTGPAWAALSLRTMSLSDADALRVLMWAGVLAGWALAAAGMWTARGRWVPAGFWLLLAVLFVPIALVNSELRLGAPAHVLALVFAGLAVARLTESVRGRARAPSRPAVARRRPRRAVPPAHAGSGGAARPGRGG